MQQNGSMIAAETRAKADLCRLKLKPVTRWTDFVLDISVERWALGGLCDDLYEIK